MFSSGCSSFPTINMYVRFILQSVIEQGTGSDQEFAWGTKTSRTATVPYLLYYISSNEHYFGQSDNKCCPDCFPVVVSPPEDAGEVSFAILNL